jgi:hypothetical protein
MSAGDALWAKGVDLEDLKARVFREVSRAFRASVSPRIPQEEVKNAVELLFALLSHRVGDLDLDAVGEEIVAGLIRWFGAGELVKLADRYEPFCKFVLRVVNPCEYARLQAETGNRLSAAKVLKALGLVSNRAMREFESCTWEQFPPASVVGQPDFLEQIARTYVFRNVEAHRARVLDGVETAQIAQSFCVFLVWTVIKFNGEIRCALTTAKFSDYLRKIRGRFEDIGTRYVELTTESRSAEEYRVLDPKMAMSEVPSLGDVLEASKLPAAARVTVIEAAPGAGKTSTLEFLAWQQAKCVLDGTSDDGRIPVYVALDQASHHKETISEAVGRSLKLNDGANSQNPWDSILLLVDGLNEVAPDLQKKFKNELRNLLYEHTELRVVVAGRSNSFHGEFEAQLVILRRLTEEQLGQMFSHALNDERKGQELLDVVRLSPFLSAWALTPLHGEMLARIAQHRGVSELRNHSEVIQYCIRQLYGWEKTHASANFGQTGQETKEQLLARLAFETKTASETVFNVARVRDLIANARIKIGASGLDVPQFVEEVLDNHLLRRADRNALEFAHELYHDYFAAVELEARQQLKRGLGTDFAFAHFAEPHWQECIRLFAELTSTSAELIERGAGKNPWLACLLMRDGHLDEAELREKVADAAYCAVSANLDEPSKAAIAGTSIWVLADLERANLLEQAFTEQRRILEPPDFENLSDEERKSEEKKIQAAIVPIGYGLLSVLRVGMAEQAANRDGRFCAASRAAIRALKHMKAARTLGAILAAWSWKTFDATALIPGEVLTALIDLGVDEVLDNENEFSNRQLAEWLARASEAGFRKAWPAYGRILRLASRDGVSGIDYEPEKALRWLRKSCEGGDAKGCLELSFLLIEEPRSANEDGEGESVLRRLAREDVSEARFELGRMLLKGEDLPKNEAEGFELLLALAEKNHPGACRQMVNLYCQWTLSPQPGILTVPAWASYLEERFKKVCLAIRAKGF